MAQRLQSQISSPNTLKSGTNNYAKQFADLKFSVRLNQLGNQNAESDDAQIDLFYLCFLHFPRFFLPIFACI